MAHAAGVRSGHHAGEQAHVLLWQLQPAQTAPTAQVAVNLVREVGQLVHHEDVNLGALVLGDVLLVLAVAEVDLRTVPELDEVLRVVRLHIAGIDPLTQQRREPSRPLHVVLGQIIRQAPEDIHLQPWDVRAPGDGRHAHQVALASAGSAAVQDLRSSGKKRLSLLRVKA